MSSSLFPLNMLPVITSIQPCSDALRWISISLRSTGSITRESSWKRPRSDAALVLAGFGVDPDLVAFVDKRRHLHDEAGLEGRRLHLRARRRALDAGHRLLHDEIYGGRQLDPDGLDVVELDADRHLGDEKILRVAERLRRDVHLLVALRVHEIEAVAVVVEILHLALVERRAFDVLFRPELLIRERVRADVPHAHLDVLALVAGGEMVQLEE